MHWEGYTYDRGIYYASIGWVLTVIALPTVAIRIYFRAFLTRCLGFDGFAILISAVSVFALHHEFLLKHYRLPL